MKVTALDVLREIVRCDDEAPGFGLCDQVDNDGESYPSADLAAWIIEARKVLQAEANEIAQLQQMLDAYRLLAVNEGWSHSLAESYGHRDYLRQRIERIDQLAAGTLKSGYDAAGYLRDGLRRG